MLALRVWLRAVLYRAGVQFGWFWVACVAWFAVWGLPHGRWNRTFDARAIGTVTRIYSDGADPPDLRIEYAFRDPQGREHINYGIDEDSGPSIADDRELDVAYVSTDPRYSELRAAGVRSRYPSVKLELGILGLFTLVGIVPMIVDGIRGLRDHARRRRTGDPDVEAIAERKAPVIWFLFLLPAATLTAIATLVILYFA